MCGIVYFLPVMLVKSCSHTNVELFIFLYLQTIRPNTDPSRQTKPPIRPNRRLILSNTAPSRQNKPPILQEFTMT